MGHGIVLKRKVPYYGSGKKLRHTIGYTGYILVDRVLTTEPWYIVGMLLCAEGSVEMPKAIDKG
jgi:hypothetical protein